MTDFAIFIVTHENRKVCHGRGTFLFRTLFTSMFSYKKKKPFHKEEKL